MKQRTNKPFANSYWVLPGKLLAGEYPLVRDEAESAVRLQNLLLSGVTCFFDLTAEGELQPYHGRLPERFSGKRISHRRFAITDHGVPTVEFMHEIQTALAAALDAGEHVYVHCRAGIGRTGATVACWLAHQGHDGRSAIEALNELWRDNARSRGWPHVPETDEQERLVHDYAQRHHAVRHRVESAPLPPPAIRSASQSVSPRLGAYQGAMLGLMIGDVLGSAPDATTASVLVDMRWSGEAATAWAMAEALLQDPATPLDQMQRYLAIQKQGHYTADRQPAGLPAPVSKAIGLWQWRRNPVAGSHDPSQVDAHALVRCVPVALRFAAQPQAALNEAAEAARTTTQAPLVLDGCRALAALLLSIIEGVAPGRLLQFSDGAASAVLRALTLKPEIVALIQGGWRHALKQPAGEDALTVLAAAMHALATTHDYQSAVVKAMHKSQRPATVGAITGALAGALYGVQGLPILWCEGLPRADELRALSERLLRAAAAG